MTNEKDEDRKHKAALVVGVFDLFHRGHLELLRFASSVAGKVIVVVNGDNFTEEYKRRPVICEDDRCAIVKSVRYVNQAVVSNSADVKPYIKRYGITSIIHGNDWDHNSYLNQICLTPEDLIKYGIEMIYTNYYPHVSTSGIIAQLMERERI